MDRANRFDVLSVGEALVDFLPSRTGPLEEVPSFERHPGGAPANVAIGVARLGGRAAFGGVVGDDPFGRYLQRALAAEGVDVGWMHRTSRARTGLSFIAIDAEANRSFWAPALPPPELWLSAARVAQLPLERTRFFHSGSNLFMAAGAAEATFAAMERARASGALVSFDPNLRLHHWPDPAPLREAVRRAAALSDVLKMSAEECEFSAGCARPEEAVLRLVRDGVRLAVVTTGAAGCVWARRAAGGAVESGRVPARAARMVDATGAGDGFMAALLAGLARLPGDGDAFERAERFRLEQVLALAVEAGTRVCERLGAVAGLPTARELGVDILFK